MELKLQLNKTLEQNAESYFDKSKKFKKKIPGIKKTIDAYSVKLVKAQEAHDELMNAKPKEERLKKEWFEKFRWFISSDGFLVIGGRDATSNEVVIKKYTDKNDIVFHSEEPGSPFVVIKNPEDKKIPDLTIQESAEFCATFSKQWKAQRTTSEVYWVTPEQVTKEAKSGEFIAKGAFMVYGKRNYLTVKLNLAVCNIGRIMSGPISAIKKQAESNDQKEIKYLEIVYGEEKLSDTGKKIQRIIGGDVDEIIRNLPQGCKIKKS